MNRPSLTVIIPTRNRPDSMLRLLQSSAKQTLSPAVTHDTGVPLLVQGAKPRLFAVTGDPVELR